MNKRNLLVFCGMLAACLSFAQYKPFRIDGTIKGNYTGHIYLSYSTGPRSYTTDSVQVKNGAFRFAGDIPHPVSAMIRFDRQDVMRGPYKQLFIEPGNMKLTIPNGSLESAKLTGSTAQSENEKLEKALASPMEKLKPLRATYDDLNTQYIAASRKKDSATMELLKEKLEVVKEQMQPYQREIKGNTIRFIKDNPGSWAAASHLRFYISSMKLEESEKIYARMPSGIRESFLGKELKKEIDGLRMGSPGSVAHVFSKKDINGKMLSLTDFKGRYVLIDFWASWCVPCRKGNPHLKSLYAKYKDKGFEIIGISDDDRNHKAWQKAVQQDGIGMWKHVLRGLDMDKKMKGEDNPEDLSDHYGISSLPTKILIDPNGVIIGRYGGGGEDDEAMDKKLKEIFGS